MNIDGATAFTGIIGWPIEHTLSPVFQNAAFAHAGLDWVYLPFKVAPDKLEQALRGLAAAGCRGLNVTMPHKQEAHDLVDEIAESAAIVSAVNTIEFKGGRLIGHNTDGPGFISSLAQEAGFKPAGARVLIIGAGGAAQSIALSLAAAGASGIKILNRTPAKAENIVGLIRSNFSGCSASAGDVRDAAAVADSDLVVNATSVGMAANPGVPLAPDHLQSGQIVCDVIYWPSETEFLRLAKQRGAKTVNGTSMLLHQGAAAFTVWTGLSAPIREMAAALEAELSDRGTEGVSATY